MIDLIKRFCLRGALGVTLALTQITSPVAGYVEGIGAAPVTWGTWLDAVQGTKQTGAPSVLLVTSRADAASASLRGGLQAAGPAWLAGHPASFAEVTVEENSALVQKLGVKTTPAILVYRKGAQGVELAGARSDLRDANSAIAWLDTLVPPRAVRDDSLTRTGLLHHNHGVQPSPQGVSQPMASQPTTQVVTQTPVVQQQIVQQPLVTSSPTVVTPVQMPSQTPVVVQAPSTPVVVQQSAPHIIVGPTPAPVVTFVQGPSAPPQVNLATLGQPQVSASQPNLLVQSPGQPMVSSPPSVASPQSGQNFAAASQPQVQTQMVQQVVQQPVVQAQAVQAVQPLVQAAGPGSTNVMMMQRANLFDRCLGAIGRSLANRGNPRLVMNPATPMTVQMPTAMAVPVQNQVQMVAAPQASAPQNVQYVQQPQPQAVQYAAPQAASPQSEHVHPLSRIFHHGN